MNEAPHKTSIPSGLLGFFANPWVGIVGSIASIFGLSLTVYFYFQTLKYPELIYYANPAEAVIVKQGMASRLTVSFDGHPLTHDVRALQIAIWNRGLKPIRRAAVLQQVILKIEPCVAILEATVLKKSREAIDLELDQSRFSKGEVSLSWNILEHNDGGIIQLIYAGGPNSKVQCLGVIEGQRFIREIRLPASVKSGSEQIREIMQLRFLYYVGIGFAIFFYVLGFIIKRRDGFLDKVEIIMFILVPTLILIGVFVVYKFIFPFPESPFGFW